MPGSLWEYCVYCGVCKEDILEPDPYTAICPMNGWHQFSADLPVKESD